MKKILLLVLILGLCTVGTSLANGDKHHSCRYSFSLQGNYADTSIVTGNGETGGTAGQFSLLVVEKKKRRYGQNMGKRGRVRMSGHTWSCSFGQETIDDGVYTQNIGTLVGASTTVSEYKVRRPRGCSGGNSNIPSGAWIAAGGVYSESSVDIGSLSATATATGAYVGAGQLNTNFQGHAFGGTVIHTTVNSNENYQSISSSAFMSSSSSTTTYIQSSGSRDKND